jgi:GNAT superfamily N-acetyltransferase
MFDPSAVPTALRRVRDAHAARIEDASLTASQPREQRIYDGWLLRYSPGKARRARSVNAVAAGELPLAEKIEHCRKFFLQQDLPCLFRVTPFSLPGRLDQALAEAGWNAIEDTRVMQLELDAVSLRVGSGAAFAELDAAGFGDVLGELHGLDPEKRKAERERFARSALRGVYYAALHGKTPIACGSALIDGNLVGIYGMVTAEAHRGRGIATAIVDALLGAARAAGATRAYLQMSADNAPARHTYSKFGFRDCYAYWYRCAPDAEGRAQ